MNIIFKIGLVLLIGFCNNAYAQSALVWGKNIGGSGTDFGKSICISKDSSYLYIAGYSNSTNGDILFNHGGFDIFISKMNINGGIIWTKTYGGTGNDYVQKIITLSDGKLLLCGFTNSNDTFMPDNHGNYDALAMKLDTSGVVIWKRLYGGTEDEGDHSMSVVEGNDKSLTFITGAKSNDGNVIGNKGSGDFWLFKTDSIGNIIWQKCLGGTGDEDGHSILQMHDGGFILAGHTMSDDIDVSGQHNQGIEDGWLLRVDSTGNIIWQKCIGGTGIEFICNMAFADSGKIMLTGFTNSNDFDVVNSHGDFEVWVVNADTNGIIYWSKTFGGANGDYSYNIFRGLNNEFTIGGYSNSLNGDLSSNHGGFDFWLLRISNNGNILWSKNFGGSLTDKEQEIFPLNDNEFIMTGFSNSNDIDIVGNNGGMDCWTIKTGCSKPSSSFSTSSNEVCAGESLLFTNTSSGAINYKWYLNNVFSTNNINNSVNFFSTGNNIVKLIAFFEYCTDTSEMVIFVKQKPYVNLGNDTIVASGNQVILDAGNSGANFHWSTGETTQQIAVFPPGTFYVDVNKNGCFDKDTIRLVILTQVNENILQIDSIKVFPVPFINDLIIISGADNSNKMATLYDIFGKIILQKKLTEPLEKFDTCDIQSGVYFLRFSGENNLTYKVLKL